MVQNIKSFCDKIDSIKKMADDLRNTPPSDPYLLKNKIENIQADSLLVAKTKVDSEFFENINDYENTLDKDYHYDYNGVDVNKL
ncbi:MAG: hypothetical protein CBD57_04620 [Candidatus Pelagibacter sp. TMED197]|jgi:hypothetical protein|nr:MAG: hypothetical protein CBD57_04620 [Candidatus Pelagibacter sp. TMED197]|tara:strand:+ start:1666 stop:1917 length:252 start_codon:yes stop_codon:yes gene_type:complete